jgi:nucleotide-binding universal stress UspA family protein
MGQQILVPVDGSPQSEKAFEYVLEEIPEPAITLLHVINPVSVFAYAHGDEFDLEGYRRAEQRHREKAERMLEEHQERAAARGLTVETVLTAGKPADRILETVEDRDVDHVVMGSHGRSGVGRVLFGSVAETVTRRSPVPVTIIR